MSPQNDQPPGGEPGGQDQQEQQSQQEGKQHRQHDDTNNNGQNGAAPVAPPSRRNKVSGAVKGKKSAKDLLRDAADIADLNLPPMQWLVPGIFPESGLVILCGPPKIGKSWILLDSALSIINGGPWLGRRDIVARKGAILALFLEDGTRRLNTRLNKFREEDPNCIVPGLFSIATEWPTLDEGGIPALEEWIADKKQSARAIIIDTWTRFRGRTDSKSDAYQTDVQALAPLQALAMKHNIIIILCHHMRKTHDKGDAFAGISGSWGLGGTADAMLLLERGRNADTGKLKITGRDIEEQALGLRFCAGMWTLEGEAHEVDLSDLRRDIIAAVKAYPGIRPKAIAEAIARSESTVRVTIRRMVEQELLFTQGGGYHAVYPQI